MIKIQNLSFPLDFSKDDLNKKAAKMLNVAPSSLKEVVLLKQSVDARKKNDIRYICSVGVTVPNEEKVLASCSNTGITRFEKHPYLFPTVARRSKSMPVVVGMGPAGLFAALFLARNGIPCILLERGRRVEDRTMDVERFWSGGPLHPNSNVQFGEGGAGTFSDGKLNTGTHDARITAVLEEFVKHGAPADILYQHTPHVGTDLLRNVVTSIRRELISLGCEIRFEHLLIGLQTKVDRLTSITVSTAKLSYSLPCDTLILAPGHSARDTFSMLFDQGVPMEAKPFAIGCRIEHKQSMISEAQYGSAWEKLPPAGYKLACHLPNGRSAFSFCVCPGGQIVAATDHEGRVVTNGMSLRSRNGENINGGFLVGVSPQDFEDHILGGIAFQEKWEHAAWKLGGKNFFAPAQTVSDFLAERASTALASVSPSYHPGVLPSDLCGCLPSYVIETLRGALPILDRKLHGFADGSALLTGVETRSSSPVRILRGNDLQSSLLGLFPCGEGAGYAGGITSAAVDGIRVAEAVARCN